MDKAQFYYDFHYSLPIVQKVLDMLGKSNDPDKGNQGSDFSREWMSQLRPGSSKVTECVTVSFRLPLSVSEISTEILRVPCLVEAWYQDRSNNWRPVLDRQRIPLKIRVSRSDSRGWFRWESVCYPIVAKKFQFRITRYNDGVLNSVSFPVGMRNTLIRRNVYDRNEANPYLEDDTDIMGNLVAKYVKDWDATKAADDEYGTFWRSEPQPDPAAVVNLYLDVRSDDGGPQLINRLYIDPIYSGQHLNLYYSSDDNVGTRKLSWVTVVPTDTLNVEWERDRGLIDISSGTEESHYQWPMKLGPQISQDMWVGVDWRPDFASSDSNLADNPELFGVIDNPNLGEPSSSDLARPRLVYDAESSIFELRFFAGTSLSPVAVGGVYATGPVQQNWSAGDAVRVVAGWSYSDSGDRVLVRVLNSNGEEIAEPFDEVVTNLPGSISVDDTNQVKNFRGTLRNLILKTENPDRSVGFFNNPNFYCDPDPVLPNEQNEYPSTTLDNTVFVAPWLNRQHGNGGGDKSHFENKTWTPIWRDYIVIKGMLHLPHPVTAKYLKMEFTNLSEQPYPIYESGIMVRYKTFPASVTQTSSIGPRLYTGEGGFLGLGTFISVNGVRSVNWLDPNSVLQAVGSIMSRQIPPITIGNLPPVISETLPSPSNADMDSSRRVEAASSYVYPRETLQAYVLANDRYNTLIKAEGLQAIQPYVDVPWEEIEAANPDAVTKVKSTGTVAIRGTDWWIYPGQQLKVPASVMNRLTRSSTVTERKLTYETRVRFNTTSVHRYQWQTARRDAAIAYFAGVREVQPYTVTYAAGEDVEVYDFPSYTSSHWDFDNIKVHEIEQTTPDGKTQKSLVGTVTTTAASVNGIITSQTLTSTSNFSKLTLDFQDSENARLMRSNPMWVYPGGSSNSVDNSSLSAEFGVIPDNMPKGTWEDPTASWLDASTVWGAEYGLASISVERDRVYDKRRMVRFKRSGSGLAGLKMEQKINLYSGAKIRAGVTVFRPKPTGNSIIIRLKRSDGVLLLEEKLGAYRLVSQENVDLAEPGEVIYGRAPKNGELIYLANQDDTDEEGLYRYRGANIPLQPVVVGTDLGSDAVNGNLADFRTTGYLPDGRWTDVVTGFTEIPEFISNYGFDMGANGMTDWTALAGSGTWVGVTNKGFTGSNSARLTTNGAQSGLSTDKFDLISGSRVSASARVTWAGLTTGPSISILASFFDDTNTLLSTQTLHQTATIGEGSVSSWEAVGGDAQSPAGATKVSFALIVPASAGSGGSVWLDSFSINVPGSAKQSFTVEFLVNGTEEEEIYVSDIYSEIAPIRYYVTLGSSERIDVTDLRHTLSRSVVTSTEPVNQFSVQAVITTDRAAAYGCKITPHYLK